MSDDIMDDKRDFMNIPCRNAGERNRKADTYNHIVKYTGLLGGIQVLTILVSVVRNKLATVLLNTVGVGLSSLYLTVIGFLHNTSGLGISFSSVKEISECYELGDDGKVRWQIEVVRTWAVWTGLAGVAMALLFSPLISLCAFSDLSHVVPLCMLSPVIGFMAVTAGELAVLKAMRRLKRVSLISVLSALVTLLISVPFYWVWGIRGVVPALLFSSLGVMVVHVSLSFPVFPWRVSLLSREHFRAGWSMVRLGVPYILATMVKMLSGMALAFFITRIGSLSEVGLYNMGYNLVVTYVGIIFAAVEADYFPRLSAVNHDIGRMNLLVNSQAKVCVLLMSPFLVLFMLAMPLVVRILYSSEFLPMTGMAVCASVHMFFKSMTLPVAYMSLAKGDSMMFLGMETAYEAFASVCIVAGFLLWGILGTGIALAVAGVFDWLMIRHVYSRRYGFRADRSAYPFMIGQFVCVGAALVLGLGDDIALKASVGAVVLAVSAGLSIRVFRRELTLFSELRARWGQRFRWGRKP